MTTSPHEPRIPTMGGRDAELTVAFVLLSYRPDTPAGLERCLASLQHGLRELGHRAVIITAAGNSTGLPEEDLLELASVTVPAPATEEDLLRALGDGDRVRAELIGLLSDQRVDLVCWADATWGLGHLAAAPPGVRTALKVAVMRTDPLFDQALAHGPDVVITNSPYMISEASAAGYNASNWRRVPNSLLTQTEPPDIPRREELRTAGPVRVVARAEPHKGIHELITSLPPGLGRDVEIVLAPAGFEYWPGMQEEVIRTCQAAADHTPAAVRILPPLPWRAVPSFFAASAITMISTTSPESWCNTAAEALSAGTPVTGYAFGHVPALVGDAGVMVDPAPPGQPATALWEATTALLADHDRYHAASAAAPGRVAAHTPSAAAAAFLQAFDL